MVVGLIVFVGPLEVSYDRIGKRDNVGWGGVIGKREMKVRMDCQQMLKGNGYWRFRHV